MRLAVLEQVDGRRARAFLRARALVRREDMDDLTKTAMHRSEFLGRPLFDLAREVMRGDSFWTTAEREYMASFVSQVNECPFCARLHARTTPLEPGGEHLAKGTVRPELAAVLVLLRKVSLSPDAVTAQDVEGVRAARVPEDAISDALHVGLVFDTLDRVANALGWEWASERHLAAGARAIHRSGYELPGFIAG